MLEQEALLAIDDIVLELDELTRSPSSSARQACCATHSSVRPTNDVPTHCGWASSPWRFGFLAACGKKRLGSTSAVWVLRGGEGAQRVRVADLDGEGVALEDLASDVAGALQRSEQRAYRYARSVDLPQILARGPVVPRGTRAVRFGSSATGDLAGPGADRQPHNQ